MQNFFAICQSCHAHVRKDFSVLQAMKSWAGVWEKGYNVPSCKVVL